MAVFIRKLNRQNRKRMMIDSHKIVTSRERTDLMNFCAVISLKYIIQLKNIQRNQLI
jgi:hypothetical protein